MLAVPIAALTATAVLSQDKGSVDPKPLPPLVNPNDPELGAEELFGRVTSPARLATHSIGFYDKGCLAGAEALPISGKTWQVMRLSHSRNWAHPDGVDAFSESQMSQASQVQEHMDVISSDLKTVGKVDHLDGPDTATLMADAAVRLKGAVRLPAKQPSAVRASSVRTPAEPGAGRGDTSTRSMAARA
jgi:hypothetical protein